MSKIHEGRKGPTHRKDPVRSATSAKKKRNVNTHSRPGKRKKTPPEGGVVRKKQSPMPKRKEGGRLPQKAVLSAGGGSTKRENGIGRKEKNGGGGNREREKRRRFSFIKKKKKNVFNIEGRVRILPKSLGEGKTTAASCGRGKSLFLHERGKGAVCV